MIIRENKEFANLAEVKLEEEMGFVSAILSSSKSCQPKCWVCIYISKYMRIVQRILDIDKNFFNKNYFMYKNYLDKLINVDL